MCGLAGFLDASARLDEAQAESQLHKMAEVIRHRGPDDSGVFVAVKGSGRVVAGLGHRRLSILDLSPAGAQPMHSQCGRFVIVFNGEIYNHRALHRELEGAGHRSWRGHSDTEVLLALIAHGGLSYALEKVDGMFALALYDRQTESLTLVRDPFGEKPLYYTVCDGQLLFASELKALQAWPGFSPEEDPQALADYFRYSYVPTPATIYKGVWKLPPASLLTISRQQLQAAQLPTPHIYWDMHASALKAADTSLELSPIEMLNAVEAGLSQSIRRRLVADVPLGLLLSGGIDSSLVAALAQQQAGAAIESFTIGMLEPGYNEAEHAKAVSQHLGTRHTDLLLTPAEVQAEIPAMAAVYDEPFADSSQVPTSLVAKMARQSVTVALSGDGGDEIFGGYNRYFHGAWLWGRLRKIPNPLRRFIATSIQALPPGAFNYFLRLLGSLAPAELADGRAGEKLHKLARLMASVSQVDFHNGLLETGLPEAVLVGEVQASILANRIDKKAEQFSFSQQAMLLDTGNYLPDDVLTKVDRASMAASLELRTPFLNRELFYLAWQLPLSMKLGQGQGKRVLREILYRHVPQSLVDRPKAGFAIPIGRWLRGDLQDWAESLLSAQALGQSNIFDIAAVRKLWLEHLSGRRDHESFLWSLLMYQSWRLHQYEHVV